MDMGVDETRQNETATDILDDMSLIFAALRNRNDRGNAPITDADVRQGHAPLQGSVADKGIEGGNGTHA
ncbi:MAG: hypothetical protein U5N27_22385 [Rhizobium sp.]|nr:hypothetical protein [Rhizobium sp.]